MNYVITTCDGTSTVTAYVKSIFERGMKLILILFVVQCLPFHLFSQSENVQVTPSGIKVYEAKGVETVARENATNNARPPKLVSEYTMEECLDGIRDITAKIELLQSTATTDPRIPAYIAFRDSLIERKKQLSLQGK